MIYFIGFAVIIAYIFQTFLGMKQIKNFNQNYSALRRKGKVLIGINKGRIVAGTIILFCLDENSMITDARKMQGTSVFANFKTFDRVIGYSLEELNETHPVLTKENKLTIKAIAQAQKNFREFSTGTLSTKPYQPMYSVSNLKMVISNQLFLYKQKFRKE